MNSLSSDVEKLKYAEEFINPRNILSHFQYDIICYNVHPDVNINNLPKVI
ncbi:hypothetical protein [Wolbachia endosymbiont of Pentidionis agamae]